METVSLYRKYRPHNFDNLVGQDHIKNTLINALKGNRVSHAYLFSGPRGTGKTSAARLLAKALNCSNLTDQYEPCNECELCNDINSGRLIDLIEIDAASNRGIDEVRDLKEKIGFSPTRSKFKIYIVDEVHMMTKEAFNALLKTLEEPPSHVYFILATTEVHKIPETIISRCQRFDFKRINKKALMTRLSYIAQKEGIQAQDTALEIISRYVDGGLRDAIGLLEQLTLDKKLDLEHVQGILGISSTSLLNSLLNALLDNDVKLSLNIINELHTQGSDLKQFLHEFIDLLREKMLEHIADDESDKASKLLSMIEIFEESKMMQESDIPQLPLEIAVIKITGNYVPRVEPTEREHKPIETPAKIPTKAPIKAKEPEPSPEIQEDPENIVPLSLASLKEKWPRITERVKRPSLRMSLRSGLPIAVDDVSIAIEFDTKFHRDKMMEHENRIELESIIKDIFKKSVKISATVKELEIKSVVTDDQNASLSAGASDDLTDQALEIFGGEVVES
ncbi:MAG: DNA polymerase III subunit gamma/tau [Candidatus Gracilibacteria bacterium]|jgi:DNA polymerase-3 subunit gamma/tau